MEGGAPSGEKSEESADNCLIPYSAYAVMPNTEHYALAVFPALDTSDGHVIFRPGTVARYQGGFLSACVREINRKSVLNAAGQS